MSFHIDSLKVTGIIIEEDGQEIIDYEIYENYMFDEVDFQTGEIENIRSLEFNIISDFETGLWEFIEKNSRYLLNLERISFIQSLGSCQMIDNFHGMISSLCNVKVENNENGVFYTFANIESSTLPMLETHLEYKMITSIY